MKLLSIICIIFFTSHSLKGQTGTLCFELVDIKTKLNISDVKVLILDTMGTEIKSIITSNTMSNCLTEIPLGRYIIEMRHENYLVVEIINMDIKNSNDSVIIKKELPLKPVECEPNSKTNCPYCNSNKKILPIKPGLLVTYNFGHNKKYVKRHDRKREKLKYEIYNYHGQDIVIGVWIPNEREKFWDFQHCWFCRKCKRVF